MTPQERIEKYGNRFLNARSKEFSIMFSDNLAYQKQLEVGYLNGATEQRMLDIEKAWKWIEWMLGTQNATQDFVEESRTRFTQAMEEEQ